MTLFTVAEKYPDAQVIMAVADVQDEAPVEHATQAELAK